MFFHQHNTCKAQANTPSLSVDSQCAHTVKYVNSVIALQYIYKHNFVIQNPNKQKWSQHAKSFDHVV